MPKKANSPSRRTQQNQLRIIGGQWRGRKLSFPDANGLRPSGDRVRETLFNWLMAETGGAHCLDLFAGSGALGFEAASRGASQVTLVENNAVAANTLRRNAELLNADNVAIVQAEALHWLDNLPTENHPCFDLVFLDPPFQQNLLQACGFKLEASGCLTDEALIYVEHARNESPDLPPNWQLWKTKTAGQVSFHLFRRAAL